MTTRAVATVFLVHADRVLIVRRGERVRTYPGRWSGISGGIDPGRTAVEQAWIEIEEETGIGPDEARLVAEGTPFAFDDPALGIRWTVHPFRVDIDRPDAVRLDWENVEARWVRPAEIAGYDTVPHLFDAWTMVEPAPPWPAAIEAWLESLRNDRSRGASQLAEAALEYLGLAGRDLVAASALALRTRLADLAGEIARVRPTMTPIGWWADRFVVALPDPLPLPLDEFRTRAAALAVALRVRARTSADRVVDQAIALIPPGSRVATASYSSLVVAACRWVECRVIALESLGGGGRLHGPLVEAELTAAGRSVELVADARVAEAAARADLVLIGADAVWPDGTVVNGTPSGALAAAARSAGRPVYILAQRSKWLAAPRPPSEDGFDVLPPEAITAIVSDE